MDEIANLLIDGLGGTSAVANLIKSRVSTVHSWRSIGIPEARMDHIWLAAQAEGLTWPEGAPCPRQPIEPAQAA